MQSSQFRLILGLCAALVLTATAGALWADRGEASDPTASVSLIQRKTMASTTGIEAAYSAAAEQTAQCLTRAGLKDVAIQRDASGKVSFTWGGFATREEAQRAGELSRECYFTHMDDIDRAWQQTPAREVEATERGWAVMRCVEAARPDFTFGKDEAALNSEFAALDRGGDEAARRCMADAGTDSVKFTPLPR